MGEPEQRGFWRSLNDQTDLWDRPIGKCRFSWFSSPKKYHFWKKKIIIKKCFLDQFNLGNSFPWSKIIFKQFLFSVNEKAPKFSKFMSNNFKKTISVKFDTEWLPRIFLKITLYKKCFTCHAGFTHPNYSTYLTYLLLQKSQVSSEHVLFPICKFRILIVRCEF
jgi:hypothetical protein